jgi:hypothetical protein
MNSSENRESFTVRSKLLGARWDVLALVHGQEADSLHLYCENFLLLKPRKEDRI